MRAASLAGAVYFAVVFALGFVLGAVRVLLISPRLGELAAVLLETPVMLAASWMASRWAVRRFGVPRSTAPRAAMGAIAFALLMAAELGVSVIVFGRTLAEHAAAYETFPGALGLGAQIVFAAMPLLS
jgi:hypothetical protein